MLTAHLREYRKAASRAPGADEGMAESELHVGELPAEAQAIATVIGRRRVERDGAGHRLDLQGVDLRSVQGSKAHLEWANLAGARLEWADLSEAHLEGAKLWGAHLEGAHLSKAHLEGANLYGAHLEWANLSWATLSGVDLTEVLGLTWPRLRTTRDFDLARVPPEVRQEAERELNAEAVGD